VRIKAYDWLARIFQHEIDHLLGVLMTDRADEVYRMVQGEDGEIEAVPIENSLRRPLPISG
jgi:peptide deformylase